MKKPTFSEPPKTFAKNQLYEPIKFYKLIKKEGEDRALEFRVREQIEEKKAKGKKKQNPLDRNIFLDKMENDYNSLRKHQETANNFYNQLAEAAFKKQRKMMQMDDGVKVNNT